MALYIVTGRYLIKANNAEEEIPQFFVDYHVASLLEMTD
jgi:hypothetical protein